jgi:hypothetical protein
VAYAPFKAVLICPVTAAAAVVAALLPGHHATSGHLFQVGCGGSYLITPGMVRGADEFQGAGGPIAYPDRVRPQQRAEPAPPAAPRAP